MWTKEQTEAIEFLRKRFPKLGQRTFARQFNPDMATMQAIKKLAKLNGEVAPCAPSPGLINALVTVKLKFPVPDLKERLECREFRSFASIYGKVRHIDRKRKLSKA